MLDVSMRTDFLSLSQSHAMGLRGTIATSHRLASTAAMAAYGRGGNAMDAALTAVIVQGVVDPAMTGIGGDCFCLIGEPGGTIRALNGSGHTPSKADLNALPSRPIAKTDAAAITIPGAVAAWQELHRAYGTLPWADLFTDAFAYAENGFPVLERVAADWQGERNDLADSQTAAPTLLTPMGKAPGAGEVWRFPELAATLRALASEGATAFYQGPRAAAMTAFCQSLGGAHQQEDFADHRSTWVEPISVHYAGTDVFECPPNGQGLVALMAFAILAAARADGRLTATGVFDPNRVEWQLRALSAGYEVRDGFIADPDACPDLVAACLKPDHIARLVEQIAGQCANHAPLYAAPFTPPHRDTVYVAARDASGLSVSLINSIFNAFGSTHVVPGTGILLHSRGQSFSTDPAHPNAYGPRKRPLHTIIPALATRNGQVETVFAVIGAHYQPQGQVHVYTAMHDCGLSPQAAQDLPRWFANPEGFIEVEASVPGDLIAELRRRCGDVRITNEPLGGSQIIQTRAGVMIAGSDPRKDGVALAF